MIDKVNKMDEISNDSSENEIFSLTFDFIEYTRRNLFITGKAGTGKTTFLRTLAHRTAKRHLIVAPTGIAAVNAKGVTINSLFQIRPGYFLKDQQDPQLNIYDPNTILSNLNYSVSKKALFQKLELLVIDEASMVRSDQVDIMNQILQKERRDDRPFGGVQIVFIGDLFQLPPVVKSDVLKTFKQLYPSPYFFQANVLKKNPLLKIEFTEIFRQSDPVFIGILNSIRNNSMNQSTLAILNSRYYEGKIPEGSEPFITITSHVENAAQINQAYLEALPGLESVMEAEINGEVSGEIFPVEKRLILKIGAQVMLVKNDIGKRPGFYNGKIGTVSAIESNGIYVSFHNEEDLLIERTSWPVYEYKVGDNKIEFHSVQIGEFIQYPLKLAWATTIHKTQGLTFDRAVIDAARSFAPGQVYVALSRVRSLEGIVLISPITAESVSVNPEIIEYSKGTEMHLLKEELDTSRKQYFIDCLLELFSLNMVQNYVDDLLLKSATYQQRLGRQAVNTSELLKTQIAELQTVLTKFHYELRRQVNVLDTSFLAKRVGDARDYFKKKIEEEWLSRIAALGEELTKQNNSFAAQHLFHIKSLLLQFLQKLEKAVSIANACTSVSSITSLLNECRSPVVLQGAENKETRETKKTVKSKNILSLIIEEIRSGKTLGAISKGRKLSQSNLEKHLLEAVKTGQLPVEAFIQASVITPISKAIDEIGTNIFELKEMLGESFTFFQIKAVLEQRAVGISDKDIPL